MDSPQVSEFAVFEDMIPEGCVPLADLRVLDAIDQNGNPCFFFKVEGETQIVSFLGHLQIIQHRMIREMEDHDG